MFSNPIILRAMTRKRKNASAEPEGEREGVSVPTSPAKEKPGKKDGAKKVAGKKDAEKAADEAEES